jgi:hypothetical protein
MIAAFMGTEEVVQYLVEEGVTIETGNRFGGTCLHLAVESGNENVTRYLLEQGAETSWQDHNGETALHEAAKTGNEALIRLLISWGADINAKDSLIGSTPLFEARAHGHSSAEVLLLSEGASAEMIKDLVSEVIQDETGERMIVQTRVPSEMQFQDDHLLSTINGQRAIPDLSDQAARSEWAHGFLKDLAKRIQHPDKNEHLGKALITELPSNPLVVRKKFVFHL